MRNRFVLLVLAVLGIFIIGCQHAPPPTAAIIDRTGWVEVARFHTTWSARKMMRVMQDEGIPAWIVATGYPSYPLSVPPEYRDRATTLIRQHGYEMFVSK